MLSQPDHAELLPLVQPPLLLTRLSAPDYQFPGLAMEQGTLAMCEPESPDRLPPIARQAVAGVHTGRCLAYGNAMCPTCRCRDGINLAGEVVALTGVRP
ncbi:hypothetical protein [Thiobacillus sp.]